MHTSTNRVSTQSTSSQKEDGLTHWRATAIVVNFVSGGIVLLPYVFAKAGIVLASVALIAVSIQTFVSSGFLLETGARAEALARLHDKHDTEADNAHEYAEDDETEPCLLEVAREELSRISSEDDATENHDDSTVNHVELPGAAADASTASEVDFVPMIAKRKFEITALNNIFLGKRLSLIFTTTIVGDMVGVLWLYGVVFSSTLAGFAEISEDRDNYMLYLGIYALIVLPISCLNLLDQLFIQYTFLVGRVVMVAFMIGTILFAVLTDENTGFENEDMDLASSSSTWTAGNFHYLLLAVQTCILSTAYQGGVPAVAAARRNRGVALPRVFRATSTIVCLTNLVLSITIVSFFGSDHVPPSANALWRSYQGSSFIAGYVYLYAAMDGLAIFPLLTATLGDILIGAVFGEKAPQVEQNRMVRSLFRLFGGILPLLGAFFVQDLGVIATYSAIFTIVSYTVGPAVLWLVSRKAMQAEGLSERTVYSPHLWFVNSTTAAYSLLAISGAIVVAVLLGPWIGFS